MKSKASRQTGQGIVTCVILASSLSLFSFVLGSASLAIGRSDKIQTQCHSSVLAAQKIQASRLNQLLALNPMALKLRKKRKLADRSLKAASSSGNPKVIAAATAFWLIVVAEQGALRAKQRALLQQANHQLQLSRAQIRHTLQKNHAKITRWKAPTELPVRSQGKVTGSPTYHTKFRFEKKQTIELEWKAPLPKEAMPWIKKLNIQNSSLKASCAATIKRFPLEWRARLIEVKSPWRLSFL